MKKNLNIAYLNGAEGMIRRGGASSGGSGGEASSWVFYKFPDEMDFGIRINTITMYSHVFSYTSITGTYSCAPSGALISSGPSQNTYNSIGVDCKALIRLETGEVLTMNEYATVVSNGSFNNVKEALEDIGLIEITKEQFYSPE